MGLLVGAIGSVANGQDSGALPKPVLDQLSTDRVPASSLSVFVQAVDEDTPLIDYRADVSRNPASVMKLVTTLAGLELLGPAYKWKTSFFAASAVKNGTIEGPLFLRGAGDPSLLAEDLWRGLRELRDRGLVRIEGDLVVDQRAFSVPDMDPGNFDGQPYRAYNAVPQAVLVDFSATTFFFYPDRNARTVRIGVYPPSSQVGIENQLRLVKGRCRGRHRGIKMTVRTVGNLKQVRFSGDYPAKCGVHAMLRSLAPDEQHLFGVFNAIWTELGGSITGQVRLGRVPEGATRLASISSDPLSLSVRGMNKHSNNVMTRQLFYTLGLERGPVPATPQASRAVVTEWLARKGIALDGFRIDNGSGLSRDARLTARQLGRLLLQAFHSPLMPEFVASLPLAGVDGTLRRRFTDSPLAGRLYMKTGLLKHVRAGAGFLWGETGKIYVLVMLHNYPRVHHGAGTQVQDRLLQWLYHHQP